MVRISPPRLFALAALAAVTLTAPVAFAQPAADDIEKDVIAAAERLGGEVTVDPQLDEIARVSVKLDRADDRTLFALGKLPCVGAIEVFDASKCTLDGLAVLKELPDLQKLVLGRCSFGDSFATALAGMKPLRVLYLGESKVSDVGLAALAKLPDLRNLDVYDTKVTDRGLAAFAEHPALEELNVSGTRITDAGLLKLKGVPTLKVVRAVRTNVTRNGAEAVEKEVKGLVVRY